MGRFGGGSYYNFYTGSRDVTEKLIFEEGVTLVCGWNRTFSKKGTERTRALRWSLPGVFVVSGYDVND